MLSIKNMRNENIEKVRSYAISHAKMREESIYQEQASSLIPPKWPPKKELRERSSLVYEYQNLRKACER